jgi:hypothetical protein
VNLIPRSAWGARPPTNRTALVKSVQKGTAVHYTASDADERALDSECAGRVKNIQNYHMDVKGWADIAYSYVVCKHGNTFAGRGLGIRTAGQGTNSGNDAYHAVVFLGDDTENRDDVTDAGRRALRETIDMCNGWAPWADSVRPHSWFHPTGCPGDDLRSWIARGMPIIPKGDGVSQADVINALKSEEGQRLLESAVDHLMSQGLTGNRDGAIRGWAIKVEQTDENVRRILEHLGITGE